MIRFCINRSLETFKLHKSTNLKLNLKYSLFDDSIEDRKMASYQDIVASNLLIQRKAFLANPQTNHHNRDPNW